MNDIANIPSQFHSLRLEHVPVCSNIESSLDFCREMDPPCFKWTIFGYHEVSRLIYFLYSLIIFIHIKHLDSQTNWPLQIECPAVPSRWPCRGGCPQWTLLVWGTWRRTTVASPSSKCRSPAHDSIRTRRWILCKMAPTMRRTVAYPIYIIYQRWRDRLYLGYQSEVDLSTNPLAIMSSNAKIHSAIWTNCMIYSYLLILVQ